MSLKCGIVGLPNVGKSTLFNCVSSGKAQSANFPFCTIEPNLGSTNVPDKRLEVLADMCKPKSVVPATVDIVEPLGAETLVHAILDGRQTHVVARAPGDSRMRHGDRIALVPDPAKIVFFN